MLDLINAAVSLFMPVAIDAAAVVVCFSVMLWVMDALDRVTNKS